MRSKRGRVPSLQGMTPTGRSHGNPHLRSAKGLGIGAVLETEQLGRDRGHRSSLDAKDWPNLATSVRSPRIGPGPVAGTEPWALVSSREAGARLERECIGFLRALSSEGVVRWSKRLHLRCKSRCRPSGYWRELGMDCSFCSSADSCNLLPTATVPQYSLG
jgi:hypothetical protein